MLEVVNCYLGHTTKWITRSNKQSNVLPPGPSYWNAKQEEGQKYITANQKRKKEKCKFG